MRARHHNVDVAADDVGGETIPEQKQQTKSVPKNNREIRIAPAITIPLTTIIFAVILSLLLWTPIIALAAKVWSLL